MSMRRYSMMWIIRKQVYYSEKKLHVGQFHPKGKVNYLGILVSRIPFLLKPIQIE